jgi:dipeptidyl aminopeptidase/acylaminoacyl peptidase
MGRFKQRCVSTFVSGLLLAAGLTSAVALADPGVQAETIAFNSVTITRFTLQRSDGPEVRYYLSKPAQKSPLVLYIQGSGCIAPFGGIGTQNRYSTIFSWLPLAQQGRYAVMAVEKPYQSSDSQQGPPGTAVGCAQEFNDHFSYDTWLATLRQAVRHALNQPYVDAKHVLVIGISEGATMAAGLARDVPEVTGVALIGATGPTQLYDFASNIYRSSDDDAGKLRRLQEIDAIVTEINADPKSTTKFAWGHTYLRWSSFFAQSSVYNLSQSKARVYLVSGMRDNSVPILSTEVIYAQLRAQGRDVTFRRVPLADHSLIPEGGSFAQVRPEYDALMAWFERR